MKKDSTVAIVGAGLAGISTAFHLSQAGIEAIIIEAGKLGEGSNNYLSGTNSPPTPTRSKMILTEFDYEAKQFVETFGELAARTYLELSTNGREMQKALAKKHAPRSLRNTGSLIVATQDCANDLREEIPYYLKLGLKNIHEWDKSKIDSVYPDTNFVSGLFFSQDAVINSTAYLKGLLAACNCPLVQGAVVTSIKETLDGVHITTDRAGDVDVEQVILATNGFYKDEFLQNKITPRWSYNLSYQEKGPNTPATVDFVEEHHYWTRQDDICMVGGGCETEVVNFHKSEYEVALPQLQRWIEEHFPQFKNKRSVAEHYGVFATTPDEIPIVGKAHAGSRINYIVGCNGIGQSTLSYAASLMPVILGYAEPTQQQQRIADFLSPQRKTLLQKNPLTPYKNKLSEFIIAHK